MAWSVLQSASTAANGTISNTVAATYGTNLSSGSKLIACVAVEISSGATISSVSDGTNSFTSLVTVTTSAKEIVALYALDCPAGDVGTKPTITAHITSSSNASILIQEVSGLLSGNTSAMLDGTAGTLQGTGGSSTGSPTYSSNAANEYLVAIYGDDGGPETWTDPSGYQGATAGPGSSGAATGVNTNNNADIELAYKNSTHGTETGSFALSGTSADWGAILVAFKIAGAAITSGPPLAPGLPSGVAVIGGRSGWQGASHSR